MHGGAGRIPAERERPALEGVQSALEAGWSGFGSALDAVEAAVRWMEGSGQFNCGRGAVLDLTGKVQLDAGIMTSDRKVGGVANLTRTCHAVSVARKVMEQTPHALLSGKGADAFARSMGFSKEKLGTPARRALYRKLRAELMGAPAAQGPWSDGKPSAHPAWWKPLVKLVHAHPELLHGTVGAVALDGKGRLAAATSTGGIFLKMEGRISDTCLFGCGTYADERVALSATGIGEVIIRYGVTRSIAEAYAERGASPTAAIRATLSSLPLDTVGVIALDRKGRFGVGKNTSHLAYAHRSEKASSVRAGVK